MPDRIVRASILTSETVAKLSAPAEVFYRRLMSVADDHGRYDGRLSILRAALYPLQLERVTEGNVQKCLSECESAGAVTVYLASEKQFVEIVKFGQRLRSESKFPAPLANDSSCPQVPAYAGASNTTTHTNTKKGSEEGKPLTDEEFILSVAPTYPHANVRHEHGKMLLWCKTNGKLPSRKRFINWLNRIEAPMKPVRSAKDSYSSPAKAVPREEAPLTEEEKQAGKEAHQQMLKMLGRVA